MKETVVFKMFSQILMKDTYKISTYFSNFNQSFNLRIIISTKQKTTSNKKHNVNEGDKRFAIKQIEYSRKHFLNVCLECNGTQNTCV